LPLTEISKSDRIADPTEALQFGNHKGASQKPDLLKKVISDDILHGYGLIIPRGGISRLPNACLAPMNITKQFTLEAGGETMDKECLTHRQSFHMAVQVVGQQKGDPREPTTMHVWMLPHETAVLDSFGKKKVLKCTNCTPEDCHQVSLPMVPPKCHPCNANHHTAT
jgi:hypothetical protein